MFVIDERLCQIQRFQDGQVRQVPKSCAANLRVRHVQAPEVLKAAEMLKPVVINRRANQRKHLQMMKFPNRFQRLVRDSRSAEQ
jgi:hypothetical protein